MGTVNVVDDIRERLKAEPFQPFLVLLGEDRRVRVFSPEYTRIWPGGRLLAFENETDFQIVDLAQATGVGVEAEEADEAPKPRKSSEAKKPAAKKKPGKKSK